MNIFLLKINPPSLYFIYIPLNGLWMSRREVRAKIDYVRRGEGRSSQLIILKRLETQLFA